MVIMSVYQTEEGDFCCKGYGVSLLYDQKQEKAYSDTGLETRQDITNQFPEKPTLEEFDWFARKYIAGVSLSH